MNRKTYPRNITAYQLDNVGVEVIDRVALRLQCNSCGQVWSPNLQTGSRLPRRWWQCPNDCNATVVET
jgi:hypothetical protein